MIDCTVSQFILRDSLHPQSSLIAFSLVLKSTIVEFGLSGELATSHLTALDCLRGNRRKNVNPDKQKASVRIICRLLTGLPCIISETASANDGQTHFLLVSILLIPTFFLSHLVKTLWRAAIHLSPWDSISSHMVCFKHLMFQVCIPPQWIHSRYCFFSFFFLFFRSGGGTSRIAFLILPCIKSEFSSSKEKHKHEASCFDHQE